MICLQDLHFGAAIKPKRHQLDLRQLAQSPTYQSIIVYIHSLLGAEQRACSMKELASLFLAASEQFCLKASSSRKSGRSLRKGGDEVRSAQGENETGRPGWLLHVALSEVYSVYPPGSVLYNITSSAPDNYQLSSNQ